jgi:cytochrome oxidase assembly protein ShyY1
MDGRVGVPGRHSCKLTNLTRMSAEQSRSSLLTWTITALALVFAFVLLGRWQVDRTYRPVDGYSAEPAAVPFAALLGAGSAVPPAAVSRQVTLTGHYKPSGQLIVAGHSLAGQPVSWVVTPLLMPSGIEVFVVRGWLAPGGGQALAAPTTDAVALTGRVEIGTVLPSGTATSAGASAHLWLGYLIRTAQSPPDPLSLQPVPAAPPHNDAPDEFHLQNAIYVAQWFLLALIVPVGWWRFLRASRKPATTNEARPLEPVT